MECIRINTIKAYDMYIGADILPSLGKYLMEKGFSGRAALVFDRNTHRFFATKIERSLEQAGIGFESVMVPIGGKNRNMESVLGLLDFLAKSGFEKEDIVVAVGGSNLFDICGVCAGLYLGGVRLALVPTTLFASVDRCSWGSFSVDIDRRRDGAGGQPEVMLALCDTRCMDSLDSEVLAQGMCEAVRCGLIAGGELWESVSRGNAYDLEGIISGCVRLKEELRGRSELTLGKTAAKAIETITGHIISGGQAMAMGLCVTAEGAFRAGMAKENIRDRLAEIFARLGLESECVYTGPQITRGAMAGKKEGEKVLLAVAEEIGRCRIVPMTGGELKAFFSR